MKKRVARPLLVATAGLAMLSVGCKKNEEPPVVTGNLMAPCVMDGGVCVPFDDAPPPPPKKPADVDAGS